LGHPAGGFFILVGHWNHHSWLISLLGVAEIALLTAVLRMMEKQRRAATVIQRKLVQLRKRLDDLPGYTRDEA
jgi:hypothetical protein